MNNNDVSIASQHLDAVEEAQAALAAEYDLPTGYRDQAKIAGLHQAINYGLKRGEVAALDAAASALEGIRSGLEDMRRQWDALNGGM